MNISLPETSLNNSQKAAQMPPEVKNRVKVASDNIGGKLHPQRTDIEYLFDVFHEHITHYPKNEKLNCNDCRVMVRDFWKHEVSKWTQ